MKKSLLSDFWPHPQAEARPFGSAGEACAALALGARPAGAAVRALAWIGPTHAGESLASLHRTLPHSEWQALASARATLPGWVAQAIGKEAARG